MKKFIIAKKLDKDISYLQNNPNDHHTYVWTSDYTKATIIGTKQIAVFHIETYCKKIEKDTNLMVLPITITIDRPIYNSEVV